MALKSVESCLLSNVAISRARSEGRIYTNDIRQLPQAIERENERYAALDLTREKGQPRRSVRLLSAMKTSMKAGQAEKRTFLQEEMISTRKDTGAGGKSKHWVAEVITALPPAIVRLAAALVCVAFAILIGATLWACFIDHDEIEIAGYLFGRPTDQELARRADVLAALSTRIEEVKHSKHAENDTCLKFKDDPADYCFTPSDVGGNFVTYNGKTAMRGLGSTNDNPFHR
jgi:hypothetical protein